MANKHMHSIAHADLHVTVKKNTEGGACLTGHRAQHVRESCSYRWQALQDAASERHARYNDLPEDRPQQVDASTYEVIKPGEPTRLFPADFDVVHIPADKDDWKVGGPDAGRNVIGPAGKRIRKGKNFTKMLWPYWNNAHHVIPKGLFKKILKEVGEEDWEIRELVIAGLLQAKYNVNHWKNVIILPMDTEVARLLRLPRHLVLEDGSIVDEPTAKFDHAGYNGLVEGELDPVIEEYAQKAAEAEEDECDAWPAVNLSKERLVRLSVQCYKRIVEFGATNPGEPLSDIETLELQSEG